MGKIADSTRTWVLGQEQKRQLLAFDAELEEANGKVRRLEAKVLDLEKKVHPLQAEVERLEQRVKEEAAKAARAEKLATYKAAKESQKEHVEEVLGEKEVEALRVLATNKLKTGERSGVELQAIMRILTINQIRAEVLMRSLCEREYAWLDTRVGDGGYRLNDKGDEYLVKHNIV